MTTTNLNKSKMSKSRKSAMDPMQRKIPENPKYKHVKATVDTGASISKYMAKIEEMKLNYKFGKDEIFKRMKVTTFVQLLIQVHRLSQPDEYDDIPQTPSSYRPETADRELLNLHNGGSPTPSLALTEGDYGGRGEPDTGRSTLLSVASGIGELDMNRPPSPPTVTSFNKELCPYLLLDLRDKDEFDQCHIMSALSYPKAILSRATNYESKEMLSFKNKEGKIIVLYDEDERIASMAATTLVQRGYDNIFMLSGGLKVSYKMFPEGLLTGTPPVSVTGTKPKAVHPADRNAFSNEDINKVEIYLDNVLQTKNTSSRMSKASTASSRQSTTARSDISRMSVSSTVLTDRPAFKP